MQESVRQPSDGSRCRGTNKRGERCQRRAAEDGLCIVHGGKLDMKAIGAKGGKSKETSLRKATRVDDELREQAREVLAKALRGEQVDKEALAAARSLFSYRSDVPAAREREHPARGGPKIVTLADLVDEAVQHGLVVAERGGAVLVDGRRVERVDPSLPRSERPEDPLPDPGVRHEVPEPEFTAEGAPEYDESAAAKLQRRYGSDEGNYRWT